MTYLGRFRMKLGENPWFGGPSRKVQNIKKSTPLLLFERKKFLTRWYQEHIYYLVAEGGYKVCYRDAGVSNTLCGFRVSGTPTRRCPI